MANPSAPMKDGKIPFTYEGETFHTYYKLFGDLSDRTRTPLIVLHGGPGLVHNYLLPLSDLAVTASIPVIIYDQLGNGGSTHLPHKPPTFWTVDLFVDELLNLAAHLSISDSFDIFGHSWGGMLASEVEVRRQPAGLKHLIVADSLAAISLWQESNAQLLKAFPKEVQEGIAAGKKEPKRYQAAMKQLHARHGCTVKPVPEELIYTFDQIWKEGADTSVVDSPIMKDWTIIDRLHLVRVPTFVINGRADMAQDFVVLPFFQKIQKVKWVTFEESSHTPFWEEREKFMKLVDEFLAL